MFIVINQLCYSLLVGTILSIPSDELIVARFKAAVLVKTSASPARVYDAMGIDTRRFEWVCAGNIGDCFLVSYRSLAKNYTVTVIGDFKNGRQVVTEIEIFDHR